MRLLDYLDPLLLLFLSSGPSAVLHHAPRLLWADRYVTVERGSPLPVMFFLATLSSLDLETRNDVEDFDDDAA